MNSFKRYSNSKELLKHEEASGLFQNDIEPEGNEAGAQPLQDEENNYYEEGEDGDKVEAEEQGNEGEEEGEPDAQEEEMDQEDDDMNFESEGGEEEEEGKGLDEDEDDKNMKSTNDDLSKPSNSYQAPGKKLTGYAKLQAKINQLKKSSRHLSHTITTAATSRTAASEKFEISQEEKEEVDNKMQDVWKAFGRETAAGKILFSLSKGYLEKPKIIYPKPKTKPRSSVEEKKPVKPCPQKTVISYPPPKSQPVKKIAPVDLIPKRKNVETIQEEIDKYYRVPVIPVNRGVDRGKKIGELQGKMKAARGALPKGAEMPRVELTEEEAKEARERAIQRAMKKLDLRVKRRMNGDPVEEKTTQGSQEISVELTMLFDQIMKEIEDRQLFLQEIKNLKDKDLKKRMKQEIIERVSDLQRIVGMQRQLKDS